MVSPSVAVEITCIAETSVNATEWIPAGNNRVEPPVI